MEIRIQSIQFDATNQLRDFIQKKVAKLEKFYDEIITAEVTLKVVKPKTVENKEAGIKLIVRNDELYSNRVCDSFEQAIDECASALEKQLTKYKEKTRAK